MHLFERRALRRLDPRSVRVGELEGHDPALPAGLCSLLDALAERRRGDEPVRRIARTTRLPDYELVQFETVLRDLEKRRSRERRSGLRDEACAVLVQALIIELDVVLHSGSA